MRRGGILRFEISERPALAPAHNSLGLRSADISRRPGRSQSTASRPPAAMPWWASDGIQPNTRRWRSEWAARRQRGRATRRRSSRCEGSRARCRPRSCGSESDPEQQTPSRQTMLEGQDCGQRQEACEPRLRRPGLRMARVIMPTRCPQAVEKISRGLRSSVARSGKRRDPQWLYRIGTSMFRSASLTIKS